ncbi:MAG TPA: hypothetical protein VF746_25215 [Longimicrobium sp.]|jgi:hypothetical protein
MRRYVTPYGPLYAVSDEEVVERIDAAGILHCIPWPGAFATLVAPGTGEPDYAVQLKVEGVIEYMDADCDVGRLLARFVAELLDRAPEADVAIGEAPPTRC